MGLAYMQIKYHKAVWMQLVTFWQFFLALKIDLSFCPALYFMEHAECLILGYPEYYNISKSEIFSCFY